MNTKRNTAPFAATMCEFTFGANIGSILAFMVKRQTAYIWFPEVYETKNVMQLYETYCITFLCYIINYMKSISILFIISYCTTRLEYPIRLSSTALAASLPSRIAHTTRDWPLCISPVTNTLSLLDW